jgi:hypothetical protein
MESTIQPQVLMVVHPRESPAFKHRRHHSRITAEPPERFSWNASDSQWSDFDSRWSAQEPFATGL